MPTPAPPSPSGGTLPTRTSPDFRTLSAALKPGRVLVKKVVCAPVESTCTTVVPPPCVLLGSLKFEKSKSPDWSAGVPVVGKPAGTMATPYGFTSAGPDGGIVETSQAGWYGWGGCHIVSVDWASSTADKGGWPLAWPA